MDLMDLGDMGSGCEEKNCGLASGFPEDCSNQECYWEEPTFELIELVCVTVIYIPLMLFGLLGNILTILVVWLRPYMRSSTYLYLSSMAVSDLLILLLLPLDLYKLWRPRPWPLGDLVCKLTMFLSECCTFCTILHITFLSLERYLAVCWPITAKTVVTRRRTKAVIGCLWLGAAVSAAPVLIMVGVEEVGGEEFGLSQWREDGGWTGMDGEHGGIMLGEGERSEHMALMDGGLEGIKWGEKETQRWSERVGELNWFRDKVENKIGDVNERKQGEEDEMKHENQAGEEGGEEEGKVEFKGEQQNKKKEDEGGGREGRVDGGGGGEIDRSECRCTHHAVSSGLLSAMMILSNLYFLVPLCILGLVYSLIGRTLWLRPKSSRRDQSHRNTVKMLGVIVLAFIVCWLPFHVGRTIYSFSLGTGTDLSHTAEHHVNSDTSSHNLDLSVEANTHTDRQIDSADVDTHQDSTDSTTYNTQNRTPTSKNSQYDTPKHTDEYGATPTNLYNDNTHNSTYPHPDTHLYFLYYLSQYFNLVSSVLFYLSAAVNPLLYNLMSARYRHAVHSLVHTQAHTQTHHLRSTLTVRHSTTTL